MCFIAFLVSCPLNCHHRTIRPSSLSVRRSILACERRPKSSRSEQTSTRQETPAKNANLFLDPRSAPTLLRSPASILSLAALGFLTATAFLTRFARRFTADIAARTKLLLASRVLRERIFARVRERTFLQSAVDATNATLENTQTYLDAQRERAVIAEDRLQKLQSQRDDLRELERRRELLLQQLANCEDELAQREHTSTTDKRKVDDSRRELETFRKRLADLDVQCDDATVELADLECAAFDAVDLVQKAAEERRSKLEETTRLIDNARNAKSRTDVECNNVIAKVDQLSESVSSALSQVEEQRRLIDDMTQRAEFIKNEIKRKRKDTHLLPETSAFNMRMKSLLDDVGIQQESVRKALSELEGQKNREVEERDALKQQLARREEQVTQLKRKLSQEGPKSETASAVVELDKISSREQSNGLGDTDTSSSLNVEIDSRQDPSSFTSKRSEHLEKGLANKSSENSSSRADVGSSETDIEEAFVENQKKGDHDQLQTAPVVELPEDHETVPPKPKRGGRRKVELSAENSPTTKSKRKDKPRETEMSETSSTKTSPKRKRGRPRKNEVISN